MSDTSAYQQGFYDGVTAVRKFVEDKLAEQAVIYPLELLRKISDILHAPPAI